MCQTKNNVIIKISMANETKQVKEFDAIKST